MTIGEIIETVLLAVSGGRLSADVDVRREDIRVLVGPVIGFVLAQYSNEELDRQYRISRINGSGLHNGSYLYSTTYKLTPVLDEDRELYYIDLPSRLLRLPGESGMDLVRPTTGRTAYIQVKSDTEIAGIPTNLGSVFFWIETVDNVSRIYLDSIGRPVCAHLVRCILDPSNLSGDTEFPVPAGVEVRAIDLLVAHFKGQRMFPQDYRLDDVDNVRAQTQQ